jgi:hypothetical protein
MKKYIFSENVGKKIIKHEIIAETLKEAQHELATGKLGIRNELPISIEPVDYPEDVALQTFTISYYASVSDAVESVLTPITYKAISMKSAEGKFLEDFPEQAGNYRETHSPLSNYAVDRKNAEIKTKNNNTSNNDNDTATTTTTEATDAIREPTKMKPINLKNLFKTVNDYIRMVTMLLISLIPLLLLGVVLFGDNFFLGNVVVYNIQQLLDSMAGFVGIVTLLLIVYFYTRIEHKKN